MGAPDVRPWRRAARWVPLAALALAVVPLLALVAGGGLAGVVAWYLAQLVGPALGVVVGLATAAYAWRRRRWRSPAVRATLAASALALGPLVWATGAVRYPSSLDRARPAASVRLPLDGPVVVAWGGDRVATNYHAATPDQRWAYDLVVAPAFVGSGRLEDYGCYGQPVRAPAAGTVTAARDGRPDQPPGRLPDGPGDPSGNHVAIRMDETGTHLLIAPLARGTVAVRTGERVAEGAVVGRCGNSGNTSEPHVHLHHQRQDPAGETGDLAEGLPLTFRDHDGPAMPSGGLDERGGRVVPTGDVVRHRGPAPARPGPIRGEPEITGRDGTGP